MADKLKEIPGKVLGWWNKFTSRQKTIIIGIAAVVIFTFAIIIYTFTRPQYTKLGTYESSTTSAEIVKILDDALEQMEMSEVFGGSRIVKESNTN